MGAAVRFNVVDAKPHIVQEAGREVMGPVNDFIVNRRLRKAVAQQRQ